MKILTPLNAATSVDELFDYGADELYTGFYDFQWEQNFGDLALINRMSSFGRDANPNSLSELKPLIDEVKEQNKKLYITLNGASYTEAQKDYQKYYLEELKRMDCDGVIVGTLFQARYAKEVGLTAIASTMCGIYNADIAGIYRDIGIDRIILPRDLSLDEIDQIISADKRNPEKDKSDKKNKGTKIETAETVEAADTTETAKTEYEVFLMRNGCRFSDSYCLGLHAGQAGGICTSLGSAQTLIYTDNNSFEEIHALEENHQLYTEDFHYLACGQCAIFRLMKSGVTTVKVVGRSDQPYDILNDVAITRRNIEIADKCTDEAEYLKKMELPADLYGICNRGLSCYYPEVRF